MKINDIEAIMKEYKRVTLEMLVDELGGSFEEVLALLDVLESKGKIVVMGSSASCSGCSEATVSNCDSCVIPGVEIPKVYQWVE